MINILKFKNKNIKDSFFGNEYILEAIKKDFVYNFKEVEKEILEDKLEYDLLISFIENILSLLKNSNFSYFYKMILDYDDSDISIYSSDGDLYMRNRSIIKTGKYDRIYHTINDKYKDEYGTFPKNYLQKMESEFYEYIKDETNKNFYKEYDIVYIVK